MLLDTSARLTRRLPPVLCCSLLHQCTFLCMTEAGGVGVPQDTTSSFFVSLELVAGIDALAECCGALLGRQLHGSLSARDMAPCFSSREDLDHRPRYLN